MARPTRIAINAGLQAWDADVNDNLTNLFDRPLAIALHSGDETDLEATFAAALYDKCLIWVDHSVDGWTLYYSTGSAWSVLTTGGGGGSSILGQESISGATTIDPDSDIVLASGTTYTITLPAAATYGQGRILYIKRLSSGTLTVDADGTETIDGATTLAMDIPLMSVALYCDGSNWHVI